MFILKQILTERNRQTDMTNQDERERIHYSLKRMGPVRVFALALRWPVPEPLVLIVKKNPALLICTWHSGKDGVRSHTKGHAEIHKTEM